jgi:hypothetical protein
MTYTPDESEKRVIANWMPLPASPMDGRAK